MSKDQTINVERRTDAGKGASRRLRHADKVPAIVYGGELPPVQVQMAHNDVWHASQNEWFYSSIMNLSLGGDVQKVLLRDMQRHPFRQQIMHLDFMRVSADELIRIRIPLRFINQEDSPAAKHPNVVIMHEMTDVEISCLPGNLPQYLEADLSALEIGDTLLLSSVVLPEGVEIPELLLEGAHDSVIVAARETAEEVDEEIDVEAEDAAEGEASDEAPESGEE